MTKFLLDISLQQARLLLRQPLLWLVTLLLAFPFTLLLAFSQLHASLLDAPYLGMSQTRAITAISLKQQDQQQPLPWFLANELKQSFNISVSYERHLPAIMRFQQQHLKIELSAFSGGYRHFGLDCYLGELSLLDFPEPAATPAIALSYEFWQRQFQSDPTVIGKIVQVSEKDYQIVAVMAPDFQSFRQNVRTDAIVPFTTQHLNDGNVFPDTLSYLLEAELERSKMAIIWQHLFDNFFISDKQHFYQNKAIGISIEKFDRFELRLKKLTALIGVLMLFCTIAYLGFMLQRQQEFQGEYQLRRMFGAERWHINLQRLLDVLLNSCLLLLIGLLITPFQLFIASLLFPEMNTVQALSWGLVFQWLIAAFCVVSLISAMGYWLQDKYLSVTLGRGQSVGKMQKWLTSGLISGQLALAGLSLSMTLLLTLQQINLYQTDLGFHPRQMHIVTYDFPLDRPSQQYQADLAQLFRYLGQTNADTQMTAAIVTPLSSTFSFGSWTLPDGRPVGQISGGGSLNNRVAENYFAVMQTPLLLGRNFAKGVHGEIVVNQTLWQRFFDQQLLADARLNLDGQSYRIVGVVQDIRYQGPDTPAEPMIYLELTNLFDFTQMIAVTSAQNSAWLTHLIDFSKQLNPNLVANAPESMMSRVAAEHAPRLSVLYLMFFMSVVSILAAGLFSYSALKQLIRQQSRELALRFSMGARCYQLIWQYFIPIALCMTVLYVGLLLVVMPLASPYLRVTIAFSYVFALVAYLSMMLLLLALLSRLITQRVARSWLELTS